MSTMPAAVSNLGALDAAHHLHPFSDMKKLNAAGTPHHRARRGLLHL